MWSILPRAPLPFPLRSQETGPLGQVGAVSGSGTLSRPEWEALSFPSPSSQDTDPRTLLGGCSLEILAFLAFLGVKRKAQEHPTGSTGPRQPW